MTSYGSRSVEILGRRISIDWDLTSIPRPRFQRERGYYVGFTFAPECTDGIVGVCVTRIEAEEER